MSSCEVPEKFKGYGAKDSSGKLELIEFTPVDFKDDFVDVKVMHCGLCMSDISMVRNHWGMTTYPLVPGHEVIGRIARVGKAVKKHKVGDLVGVSGHSGYCKMCDQCMSGQFNTCLDLTHIMVGGEKAFHGGFANYVRCQDIAAIPIPDGIDPKDAGPLLCAGITVYNPMKLYDLKSTDKVAVIGIGGLGHMALQFCRAWGCEVTAFTTSASKTEEAKKLGAHKVIVTTDASAMKAAANTFNMILSTVNVKLDWDLYMSTLAPRGNLVMLGIQTEPISFQCIPMIFGQRIVSGSIMGSPQTTSEMLEFAALHGIKPQTEHFKSSEWEKAFDKVDKNTIRFRGVFTPDF